MKKIVALLFFALIITSASFLSPINAQNSSNIIWQEMPLQSGEVAEIVISPSNPNIMYAGFEVNSHSLYKSEDGGRSWTKINGGGDHTKDVAVSPGDPNRVYFAMSEALQTTDLSFRSTARSLYGGPPGFDSETQVILSTGIPAGGSSVSFSSVEIFEEDDNVIYVARKGGGYGPLGVAGRVSSKIYKTVNRGQSWSEFESNLSSINVLAIHPTNHNIVLAGSSDGIYKSEDSGRTLNKLQGLSNVISLEFQLDNPNIVYAGSASKILKTTDGGGRWQEITGPLKDVHRVRVSRSHPNVLYASTDNGVFRSDNGGNSWRDASGPPAGGLKSKNIQIVEIHPTNPDIAFIGHSSLWSAVRAEDRYRTGLLAHQGIFKTEDGGKSWVRSDTGIKEYNFEEVAVNPGKPYEAWVLSPASRGGYKTEDGGGNFRLTQTPTFHYPMRVKFSMQNPNKVYATGWQNGAPFSYSENGGVNWKFVSEEAFFDGLNRGKSLFQSKDNRGGSIHVHGLAVDPKDDKIIYAGSISDVQSPVGFPLKGAHIFKSTNGGESWRESDEGFPHSEDTAIHDITIDPVNSDVIYVSTTRHESERGIGVYKSENSGESWFAVSSGLSGEALSVNALVVSPQNTNELVIATFGGLYKSENAGASWRKTHPASSFDVEYVIDDPSTVYASSGDGVLVSYDFGNSWNRFGTGLPQGPGHGIGVDKTGRVIYAAVGNHGPEGTGGGFYVARLRDILAKDPVSEFGSNPYSFGPFGPGGFSPFGQGGEPPLFMKILVTVVGIFVVLALVIFVIIKFKRRSV